MTGGSDAFLRPHGPLPPGVGAASTLRTGGHSKGPFESFNLGDHVGDASAAVRANRQHLQSVLSLPAAPHWLDQVHGNNVAHVAHAGRLPPPTADAAVTTAPGTVLAIMTADCLPVLLWREDGTAIGAAHAGWRSLAGGILERTVAALGGDGESLVAWLGPAIGPAAFEVGPEVRAAFVDHDATAAGAFAGNRPGHYLADLFALARQRLAAAGVTRVSGGGVCTYSDPARFFSFRRDGQCGRMATVIWLQPVAR